MRKKWKKHQERKEKERRRSEFEWMIRIGTK